MQCLGEMVAFLPLPGAIPQFGSRFVDEAMGFALGWNVGLRLCQFTRVNWANKTDRHSELVLRRLSRVH